MDTFQSDLPAVQESVAAMKRARPDVALPRAQTPSATATTSDELTLSLVTALAHV